MGVRECPPLSFLKTEILFKKHHPAAKRLSLEFAPIAPVSSSGCSFFMKCQFSLFRRRRKTKLVGSGSRLNPTVTAGIYSLYPERMPPLTTRTSEEGKPIHRTLLGSTPVEGLPGWETRLYMIEYSPGADGSGHHHPVVGVGYMLRGTIPIM